MPKYRLRPFFSVTPVEGIALHFKLSIGIARVDLSFTDDHYMSIYFLDNLISNLSLISGQLSNVITTPR